MGFEVYSNGKRITNILPGETFHGRYVEVVANEQEGGEIKEPKMNELYSVYHLLRSCFNAGSVVHLGEYLFKFLPKQK